MDILQQLNINGSTAALLGVGLCALCIVAPLLLSGLHIIAGLLGIVGHIVGAIIGVIGSGPEGWCGCLVVIGGCGFIAFVVWLIATGLSSCGTNPTNFCALFGR